MKITAITLGPIVDTFTLVEKPAGLWAASYTFSWLCREIIKNLCSEGVPVSEIVSPSVTCEKEKISFIGDKATELNSLFEEGVGLFHDRIVIMGDCKDKAKTAIDNAVGLLSKNIAETIGSNVDEVKTWLTDFLRIPFAVFDLGEDFQKDKENPLTKIGKLISAMELEPSFPSSEKVNYMLSLMRNISPENSDNKESEDGAQNNAKSSSSENANLWLYRKKLIGKNQKWIFDKPQKYSLEKIDQWFKWKPEDKRGKKYENYYAVIQSDGDSVGKLLEQLNNEDAKEFSWRAMSFAGASAELVKEYGGLPIYAGGDDLLAIVPLFGKIEEGMSIFGLLEKINEKFYEVFIKGFVKEKNLEETLERFPTLSFGISVHYKKYPLYEALETARNLLDNDAKTEPKNALAFQLAKHSGQTHKFVLYGISKANGYSMSKELKILDKMILAEEANGSDTSKRLSSLAHLVENNRALFIAAFNDSDNKQERVGKLINNLLDNAGQREEKTKTHRTDFADLAKAVAVNGDYGDADKRLNFLLSAMRIQQFMFEETSGEEKGDSGNNARTSNVSAGKEERK